MGALGFDFTAVKSSVPSIKVTLSNAVANKNGATSNSEKTNMIK